MLKLGCFINIIDVLKNDAELNAFYRAEIVTGALTGCTDLKEATEYNFIMSNDRCTSDYNVSVHI